MEKEPNLVGEAQHGLPVHAVVQVVLQQLLIQHDVIADLAFVLQTQLNSELRNKARKVIRDSFSHRV